MLNLGRFQWVEESRALPTGLRAATETRPMVSATPGTDFEGIPATGLPSDSHMAVRSQSHRQTVNVRLAVYSKTGPFLSGPTTFGTFFAPARR